MMQISAKLNITTTKCPGDSDIYGAPIEPDSVEQEVEVEIQETPDHWGTQKCQDLTDMIWSLEKGQVCTLKLCEKDHLILRPDIWYKFEYDHTCPSCRKAYHEK